MPFAQAAGAVYSGELKKESNMAGRKIISLLGGARWPKYSGGGRAEAGIVVFIGRPLRNEREIAYV